MSLTMNVDNSSYD